MAKNKITITPPQIEEMMNNYRVNFPHLPLPPLFWLALSDAERSKANDAPPHWKFGILPPKEFQELIDSAD